MAKGALSKILFLPQFALKITFLVKDKNYNKNFPPENTSALEDPKQWNHPEPMEMLTWIEIFDVMDINQGTGTFSVFVGIIFEWFDSDLKYAYLKNYNNSGRGDGNEINETIADTIWTPDYDFAFKKDKDGYTTVSKRFVVRRKQEPKMSGDIDQVHPAELYAGSKNSLRLTIYLQAKFECAFPSMDENYPFGNDYCNFYIYTRDNQNRLVNLKLAEGIKNSGPSSFSQYTFENWEAKSGHFRGKANLKAIRVQVNFKLKIFSIFMITYLPTILMNIINYASNFIISESRYDLLYTINITSMMVLTSIYLSVSTSLPSTPNIKPVEIWLLFNLAFPFMVILINVVMQVLLYLKYCYDINISKL